MFSVTAETIGFADNICEKEYGIPKKTLMQNAVNAIYTQVSPLLNKKHKILFLCGKGNNAGDGYGVAALLLNGGFDVTVCQVLSGKPKSPEAFDNYDIYEKTGGKFITPDEYLSKSFGTFDVIIDAVFGVGFTGTIENDTSLFNIFQKANNEKSFKIAIDVPSGINSTDGTVKGISFKADFTVCLAFYKTGMLSYPAREYCGKIVLCDVGFPKELCKRVQKDALICDDEYIKNAIPKRESNTHKGTYGTLLSFCGSENMTGAAYLCSMAALRSGVGLLKIASDNKTLDILKSRLSEPVFCPVDVSAKEGLDNLLNLCDKSGAVLIGCGLGTSENTKNAVKYIIRNTKSRIILDADGINAISDSINILKEAAESVILTPHPAEFSRISGFDVKTIQSDRINKAKAFAKEYSCTLMLKGASTVICDQNGNVAINTTGNPGLSKGGSGDVLAGLCASLFCQGLSDFDAAVCSSFLHGKAADNLAESIGQYGLLPSDLPLEIAKLLP